MSILDKTAELLTGKKKQSSADLWAAHQEVQNRLGEIEREVKAIKSRDLEAARETGTAEQVRALESQLEALQSEERTLLARRSRIFKERQNARADEAVRDAAKTKKALNEAVSHAEQLREQLAAAESEVNRQMTGLREMRQMAGNNAALDLDSGLAQRLAFVIVGPGNHRTTVGDRDRLAREFAPPKRQPQPAAQAKGGLVKEGTA
ncbi:BAR domain-containing protein [Halovibrio salipaludis]|nr:hypothetical protein [Halovibrio salipaludis]